MTRRTKIVATLGPATDGDEALVAIVRAGVDVVRLNLSHGSVARAPRSSRTRAVGRDRRSASRSACSPTSRDRRSGQGSSPTPGVQLEAGSVIRFEVGDGPSDAELIHVDYPGFLDDLAVGDRVVIGDGAIALGSSRLEPDIGASPWSRTAGGHRAAPGCTCRRSGRGSRHRPRRTWCSPRRWRRPASSSSPCRSCAHAGRHDGGARGRRRSRPARRQDRDERGARRTSPRSSPCRTRSWSPAATSASTARSRTCRTCRSRSCGSASSSGSR